MGTQATYGIAITATDKTAKGVSSAEKRVSNLPKAVQRSSSSAVRSFGKVEAAMAEAFGNKSITSGVTSRLGAIRKASAAAGEGFGEAASEGGVLTRALGGLGVVAGATIGVIAAAGFAAFKLADGWAKGAAAIGRTADTIGIATKALQEFQAAGERAGVDKGATTGALGGISQALNDARYGRNAGVLQLMAKLGLKFKYGKDGQIDLPAMTLDIADAIARQRNAQARRRIAGMYGIGDAALPMFLQGAGQLRDDMADVDKHGLVIDEEGISKGRRIVRKGAIVSQMKDRAMGAAGELAASAEEAGYDGIISGGRYIMDGSTSFGRSVQRDFVPAARKMDRAADKMERAADRMGGPSGLHNGTLSLSQRDIIDLKKTVATEWNKRDVAQGEGVIDTILNRQASGHWGKTIRSVVNAKSQFSDVNGPVAWKRGRHSVADLPMSVIDRNTDALVDQYLAARASGQRSVVGDNLNYANPYYSDARNRRWIDRLSGPTFGHGKSVHRHGTTPELDRYRPGDYHVALPGTPIPVKVEVIHRNAPPGTRTKVTAGAGSHPSVSYAFEPVHGG